MTQLKNFTSKGFEIAYRTVVLLMSLQIVLGVAWLLCNMAGVPDFAETRELLEISNTWVLDEYIGIGYPVCVWLARIPETVTGVSYALFLYVFQIVAAFFANRYFLKQSGIANGRKLVFGTLYLMTIPMVAQFHVSVLPYSFAGSLFMVMLGEAMALCKGSGPGKKSLCIMGGCWFLGALLLPEYLWIMGIVSAVVCGLWLRKNKKGYLSAVILLLGVFLLSGTIAGMVSEPGSRGRMEKSVSGTILARVVWPNVDRNSFFWSEKVTDLFTEGDLAEISHEPENLLMILGYEMEENYGQEIAREEYMQMVGISWNMRTKEIVTEIGRDFLSYLFPNGAVWAQFRGYGVSYSGWNYSRMQDNAPLLTKYYVNLSLTGFFVQIVLAAFMLLCRWNKKMDERMMISAITVFLMAVWYTMEGAGIWNYKNMAVSLMLWASLVVLSLKEEVPCDE